LSAEDLTQLFEELQEKAREALEYQLATARQPAGLSAAALQDLKNQARSAGQLAIIVYGADGEQVAMSSLNDLRSQRLPDAITTVTYDSAISLKTYYNLEPENRFRLVLDFSEPPGFDKYNPNDQPTPNSSNLEIIGPNATWVTGVHEAILGFLRKRGTRRGWLHSHSTYNLYQWFFAIPASLWVVFRGDQLFSSTFQQLHVALRGAVYVYLFLLAFLLARIVVYGVRWVFPLVELDGSRSKKLRAVAGTIVASLALALVYDVLRAAFS
jgi:hypothetical protein